MSYAEEAAAVSGMSEDERQSRGLCCVRGCLLPGTVADGTLGSKDWLCRVHHGAAYAEHASITAHVSNRIRFYTLALRLINSPPARFIPDDVTAWVDRNGRADILAKFAGRNSNRMTCRNLGAFMLMVLDHECRAPQQRIPQVDRQTQAAGGFVKAAELVEGLA